MLDPGTVLQERIEIREILGKGGYGAVYKAYHRKLERDVAVKELLHRSEPSFVNRFEEEARILARLRHPQFPTVFDSFCEHEGFYYVMDYIPGENLGAYVQRQPDHQLDEETAIRIISPILDALHYLHQQTPPVIHRDIKHANIRITPDGNVFLVDFGIAKVYDPEAQTSTTAQAVTPGFSPLEQYRGGGATDPRTDLYAVGATLYYMLSGIIPPDAIQRIQSEPHNPLEPISNLNPTISSSLEAIIHRLLAMQPEHRYQQVQSLKQALENQQIEPDRKAILMKDFEQIARLKKELEQAIKSQGKKTNPNILDRIRMGGLQALQERLGTVERILQRDTYDLIFIGTIGTGKTTAICHLFDLLRETKVTKKINAKRRQQITIVQELFSTGSGHTTIGEVVIVPDSATFLEIEPYNEKDLKDYIKEFCDYIWFKVSPSPDEKDGAGGKLSYELEKAIRNITGLTSQSSEVEDGDEQEQETPDNTIQEGPGSAKGKRKIRIDPAEELARQFASDQSEDFFAAVVGKANLENRVETRIDYDASLNKTEQEKSWLRETFEKINLGRLPNFSVPRRVIAHVSARILDLSDYPQIGSIIDTRGIATDISREDLETYIRSRDDTLCIFTDLFPQAPSTIADLMKRFLIAEAHDLATKSMLMVLYKKGEPEKVHDTGGEVEDQEEGIAVKRATIEQELHTQQINLPADNILFYDALQYYDEYKRFNQDYEEEDIQEKRHYILQNINSILERRETKLWNEIQELEQRYQSIQKGRGLDPEDEALINQVREEIKGYHHQNFIVTDFIEQYIGTWMPKYPTRLRAVNNRHGIYDDINIYVVVKGLVEGMVRKLFQRPKNKVFEAIGRMNQPGASTNLKPFIEAFLIQVDAYYEELIEKVGEETVTFLKGKVFAPQSDGNNFWYSVQNRWGKGPGYKDDVIKTYENELEKADATGRLQEIGERLWREIFFDRVLRFFQ